jgi:hypothetical protein
MKRKRPDEPPGPTFDAPLLQAVAGALLRRRKAIRYQAGWSCEREFSETDAGVSERLNLDLHPGDGDLRLSVWADGLLWLRLCVAGPGRNSGWAFLHSFSGSVLDVAPETLVGMIEATLAEPFLAGQSDPTAYRERLHTIWKRVQPCPDR